MLEHARHALVFASGQSAGSTALSLVLPGRRVVATSDLYGGTRQLFGLLARYGIGVDYVTQPTSGTWIEFSTRTSAWFG